MISTQIFNFNFLQLIYDICLHSATIQEGRNLYIKDNNISFYHHHDDICLLSATNKMEDNES